MYKSNVGSRACEQCICLCSYAVIQHCQYFLQSSKEGRQRPSAMLPWLNSTTINAGGLWTDKKVAIYDKYWQCIRVERQSAIQITWQIKIYLNYWRTLNIWSYVHGVKEEKLGPMRQCRLHVKVDCLLLF